MQRAGRLSRRFLYQHGIQRLLLGKHPLVACTYSSTSISKRQMHRAAVNQRNSVGASKPLWLFAASVSSRLSPAEGKRPGFTGSEKPFSRIEYFFTPQDAEHEHTGGFSILSGLQYNAGLQSVALQTGAVQGALQPPPCCASPGGIRNG